ncbi:MAG: DUF2644 domain-containing protein [Ignavibacteria bacterium]|nr:DUF2644 domain-containing protein [Ignavibacteria bacterium]
MRRIREQLGRISTISVIQFFGWLWIRIIKTHAMQV